MTRRRLDPVLLEVLRGQLQGVVEEMGELVLRCGRTVFVKETQDFVVALVTPEGEVAACSQRVGIWIGIGQHFKAVIDAGGPYEPGDVWFTNDPEQSAGLVTHLPDVFCWRPIFSDGELLCFATAFLHCTDVGGLAPGSISPSAVDQYQEGVVIPVTRLVAADEIREEILAIFLRNSRIPDQNRGDLLALLGALRRAEQRLGQLVAKVGAPSLRDALSDLLDYAEDQARAIIRDLPDGDHTFWDYLEGDLVPGGRPVRIKVALRVRGDSLTLDFEGTDPQVAAAFNIPSHGRDGHYLLVLGIVNYMRTVQPHVVYNSGLVRPVRLAVPRGTLLNPEPHAPCGVRQATFFRVADVVLGALAVARPDRLPAAGCGQGSIMLVSTPTLDGQGRNVSIVQPLVGGSGGRCDADGTDGVDFATGFYRNIPTEVLEAEVPVLVERYGLRPDSGAPGRFRGGAGLSYSLRVLAAGSLVTARGLERFRFQPWGRGGGRPGSNGSCVLEDAGGAAESIGKIDVLEAQAGEVIHVETAGGGGFGNPFTRAPELVHRDVVDGLVSAEQAEQAYGVVLCDGAVDPVATARRRSAGAAGPATCFAYGPTREVFEARWPDALQSAVAAVTLAAPPVYRQPLRLRLQQEVEDGGAPEEPGELLAWLEARASSVLAALGPRPGRDR